jgi:hypothetical protein
LDRRFRRTRRGLNIWIWRSWRWLNIGVWRRWLFLHLLILRLLLHLLLLGLGLLLGFWLFLNSVGLFLNLGRSVLRWRVLDLWRILNLRLFLSWRFLNLRRFLRPSWLNLMRLDLLHRLYANARLSIQYLLGKTHLREH